MGAEGDRLQGSDRLWARETSPRNRIQESRNSGIAPGHDPVETGMHLIRLAFAQQLIRGGAPEAGQWLGAEPGVGGERGSAEASSTRVCVLRALTRDARVNASLPRPNAPAISDLVVRNASATSAGDST